MRNSGSLSDRGRDQSPALFHIVEATNERVECMRRSLTNNEALIIGHRCLLGGDCVLCPYQSSLEFPQDDLI